MHGIEIWQIVEYNAFSVLQYLGSDKYLKLIKYFYGEGVKRISCVVNGSLSITNVYCCDLIWDWKYAIY